MSHNCFAVKNIYIFDYMLYFAISGFIDESGEYVPLHIFFHMLIKLIPVCFLYLLLYSS